MNKKYEHVKSDIILIISFMTLLFTLCLVLYTDTFLRDTPMDVETKVELKGGKNTSSDELQSLIPYQDSQNKKYITAYQDKKTMISDVHNSVILSIAYSKLSFSEFSGKNLLKQINYLYGEDIFVVNDSFAVNDRYICSYNNDKDVYTCSKVLYNDTIYKAKRKVTNISISSNQSATLSEDIIFYSVDKENENGNVTVRVYADGLYNKQIAKFVKNDTENVDDYLNNEEFIRKYKSIFKLIDDHYVWESTDLEK